MTDRTDPTPRSETGPHTHPMRDWLSLELMIPAQTPLLDRVLAAQREVSTTQSLFSAMGAQVGVSMATILPWHQLVTECWQVSIRYRQEQTNAGPSGDRPNQSLDTE